MRVRGAVLAAGATTMSLAALVAGGLSSTATAQGQAASQRVIVVLKDQDQGQPATPSLLPKRRAFFQKAQAPVISQLSQAGATSVQSYSVVDAVSATVTPGEASSLASNSAVSEVVPDQPLQLGTPTPTATGAGTAGGAAANAATCGTRTAPELDPQALETIGADSDQPGAKTARSLGITGAGVKVGFIADGLNTNDIDFIRPNGRHVFVDYKDFSGDGTSSPTGGAEAFLDASSIAAQGRVTYNVSQYSGLPLSHPCDIRIEGVAPGASLVGLDVFGPNGTVYDSTFLDAINYAVADGVNVLNESLGSNYYPDDQGDLDVIKQANDAAVAAGVTVTVSAGDAGATSTIGTPATDPDVIDAGATTTFRGYAETNFEGYNYPGVTGWLNDNISGLSSGGFEQDGRTVDLVAPGDLNWALCSPNLTLYADCENYQGKATAFQLQGGTSEAAPLTAGAAALVIQAYRQTHGGVTPTPAQVKQLLVSNTDDIGSPADQQGTGRLDAYKAVVAAESLDAARAHNAGATPTVVDGSTQLHVTDQPNTPETLSDTITDAGSRPETLNLSTRTLSPYTTLTSTTVRLSDFDPQLTDETGESDNLRTVTFTVPAGENRLDVSLAFQGGPEATFASVPQLTLIDPAGRYAAYDIPEGNANYGDSQVTDPAPGTWTALVFAPDSGDGGFTGPVKFAARAASYTSFGSVSPSTLSLAPGQSAGVTLHVATPSTPGDTSGAIVVSGQGPGQNGSDDADNQAGPTAVSTIPVTLRSVIPAGPSSFTDQATGGNGRGFLSGQTFYYQLDVPSGAPELNARIALANNPDYPFQAWLVDPSGDAEAYASNVSIADAFATTPGTPSTQLGAQLHVLSPAVGSWTVIVEFGPTAGGTQLSEPFTVTTDQAAVPATSGGVPDATASQLTAGTAYTYDVTVKNTGTAPESFFPDARLSGQTQLSLGAVTPPTVTAPIGDSTILPTYLVPTDSTSLIAKASTTGPTPIEFDTSPGAIDDGELGDPDIGSTSGTDAVATFSAGVLPQGGWDIAPDVVGPFGRGAVASEPVSTSMSAITSPFDPTVSSPSGDLEADSADVAALPSFAPVTVPGGQTATIPVTITPRGASGTTVSGTLYLDDYNDAVFGSYVDPVGDQVAAIPYSYTIK